MPTAVTDALATMDMPAVRLHVRLITGDDIPADIVERSGALQGESPFGCAAWWANWWRHLRPAGCDLFLVTVWRGEELVGLAPCYRQRLLGAGQVVRFLGDNRACSDYVTFCTAPDSRAEVWAELTRWFAEEAGKSWDAAIFCGTSAADQPMETFCRQLGEQGVLVDQRTVSHTWRTTLPSTWEEFVAQFSTKRRRWVRQSQREMYDSGRAVLRSVASLADLEAGFRIQLQLHQRRRNSLHDSGCFADPRFEQFIRAANRGFLADSALRLQWTEIDGEPVAFDSGFVGPQGAFVYQTAFDPAKAELTPGRLHLLASIRRAIAEGHQFFDFLRGDEPYKAQLRAQPIAQVETRLIARKSLPRLRHRFWKWKTRVKAYVRNSGGSRRSTCESEAPAAEA